MRSLGSFSSNVIINEEKCVLNFHVLPVETLSHIAVVGCAILDQFDVNISSDGLRLYKKQNVNFLMEIIIKPESPNERQIDWAHVEKPEHREAVTVLVEEYQLNQTKTADISMSIVLKADEPVFH